MSAAGDARRARLGARLVKAAHDAADNAPPLSPRALAAIAALIREHRITRRPRDVA